MAAMTDLRQPDVDEARRLLDTAEGQPLTREQVTVTASADGACIGKTLRALKRASTRPCPLDHGTGSRSQILIEATSTVPAKM
jgi:aminoglycoside phosphotransferase